MRLGGTWDCHAANGGAITSTITILAEDTSKAWTNMTTGEVEFLDGTTFHRINTDLTEAIQARIVTNLTSACQSGTCELRIDYSTDNSTWLQLGSVGEVFVLLPKFY